MLQQSILKDIYLDREQHERAKLFFVTPDEEKRLLLEASEDYENIMLTMRHIHNYIRNVYKREMNRFTPLKGVMEKLDVSQ